MEIFEEPLEEDPKEADSTQMLSKIIKLGIDGFGPLSSAKQLGDEYIADPNYTSKLERIEAISRWEERKNFTTGFVTGLGGFISLPLAIPGSLAMNWILQTRMVAAMAYVGGFNIDEAPVRSIIGLSLLGESGKTVLNANLADLHNLPQKSLFGLPKRTLLVLNRSVATRLMHLAAQKGLTRLSKAIPIVGGILGGALDYQSCKETSKFAMELFQFNRSTGKDAHTAV